MTEHSNAASRLNKLLNEAQEKLIYIILDLDYTEDLEVLKNTAALLHRCIDVHCQGVVDILDKLDAKIKDETLSIRDQRVSTIDRMSAQLCGQYEIQMANLIENKDDEGSTLALYDKFHLLNSARQWPKALLLGKSQAWKMSVKKLLNTISIEDIQKQNKSEKDFFAGVQKNIEAFKVEQTFGKILDFGREI